MFSCCFTTFFKGVLTMDTSNSDLHVSVLDLEGSPHSEDRELVKNYEEVLEGVVKTLQPVLRYLCSPRYLSFHYLDFKGQALMRSFSVRCVQVGNFSNQTDHLVFLTEKGKFFMVVSPANSVHCKDDKSIQRHLDDGTDDWKCVLFDVLLQKLQAMLAEAEEKRQKHLEAVASRRRTLDKLLAVLQESAEQRPS